MQVILYALAVLGYGVGALAAGLLCVAAFRRRLWLLGLALAAVGALQGSLILDKMLGRLLSSGASPAWLTRMEHGTGIAAAILMVLFCISRAIEWRWSRIPSTLRSKPDQRFWTLFGASLAVPGLTFALYPFPEPLGVGFLAPLAVLFIETLRRNVFGLLVEKRRLLLIVLGASTVIYLLAVKVLADSLSNAFDTFTPLVELALILPAAVLWLPLLAWMGRIFERRSTVYAEFGKRVIDRAEHILDARERADALAAGIQRALQVSAVRMTLPGDETEAESLMQDSSLACVRRATSPEEAWLRILAATPYNYAVPVRHEGELMGILWLDTRPREFLDEHEPVLLELCRQMGHSLHTRGVVVEKIQLEKSLLAQQQMAVLGNLAATIAHEVKNPLSSIRALAQLMKEDQPFSQKYERDLGYIIGEADRLNASLRQLLTFARPPREEPREVDVSALVERIAHTLKQDELWSRMAIRCQVEPGLVLRSASGQCIEQIVWNLALNALQALSPGGWVEIAAESAGGDRLRLRVADNGPGIAPANRERVFEPYFTTRQAGTGLGLSIVQKNVSQLSGTLRLESPVSGGTGTCFTVELPRREERGRG